MPDLATQIMRDIESDPTIDATKIIIEIKSTGFLKKRKEIHLAGSAKSEIEKNKAMKIVAHFAGDNYEVVNDLTVKP